MDKKNCRVDRSSFSKTSCAGIAATGLVPACAKPPSNRATPSAQEQPRAIAFFTRQDFSRLQMLAERVFPEGATSPGLAMSSGPHTSVVNPRLQMWDYDDALINRWFRKPSPLA